MADDERDIPSPPGLNDFRPDQTADERRIPTEISEDEFRKRVRTVVEDYTRTTTDTVPNLGSVLSLSDEAGKEFKITNHYDSLFLQWDELIGGEWRERRVFFTESPLNTGSLGFEHTLHEVLEFVEGKVAELLAPIKQSQRSKPVGQSQG